MGGAEIEALLTHRFVEGGNSTDTLRDARFVSIDGQIQFSRKQHEQDIAQGYGSVELPFALARKYPNADKAVRSPLD
jgi:hypothetical protein